MKINEITIPKISLQQFRDWIKYPNFINNFKFEKVPGVGITNGAIKVYYKDEELGYIGFPLELLKPFINSPLIKWIEQGQDEEAEKNWSNYK